MQTFFALYLISVPLFFIVDLIWLGVIAKNFYREQLGNLMGDINWVAALMFYFVYLVGVVLFAVYPAVEKNSLMTALIWGALFGFFTYATYDLTNLSTLRDWPLLMTVVDIVWGTVLGAAVASGTYFIYIHII